MKFKNVIHRFESIAEQYPEQIAVRYGSHDYSYRDLNFKAHHLAYLLHKVTSNIDKVGVVLPSGINLITALVGIFKAGGVYVPISIDFSDIRWAQIIDQCEPKIIIGAQTDFEKIKAQLESLDSKPLILMLFAEASELNIYKRNDDGWVLEESLNLNGTNLVGKIKKNDKDDNYIFYTSGSTGKAKAILGSHQSLSHFIDWEIEEFKITRNFNVSQLTHPVFDASLRDIFIPLCTGGTLCIPKAEIFENPERLVEWLILDKISLIHCVPSLLRLLMNAMSDQMEGLEALKYVLVSGEAFYVKDVRKWREKVGNHVQLANLYGTTETTLIKTFYRVGEVDNEDNQVIPVGRPISKTVVAVINHEHLCEIGEIGEVYIKTPYWSQGYLFDENLNKEVFVQNPLVKDREDIVYKTGDLGRYLKSGEIEIRGRLDYQTKINGIRVEPGEIEKALINISEIEQAIVINHQNSQGNVELIAYYTGVEQKPEDIRALLAREVNKNIIPGYIQYLDKFPLTITGKVDRKALPKPSELWKNDHTYIPVESEIEEKLEVIWEEVLDVKKIGRSVSFFSIGGTSLKAIQLISRIFKEFDVLIKIVDIFSNPTIEKLGVLIDKAPKKGFSEIPIVSQSSRYLATHQQKQLWVQDQKGEGQQAYNMPHAFELKGPLDQDALARAWHSLVARHESLRTYFSWDDNELYQHICDVLSFDFAPGYDDVSNSPNPEAAADVLLTQLIDHTFKLGEGPLFYTHLIKMSESRHYVFFNAHHIISDGWSMHVMARDVLSYYHSYVSGSSLNLPSLRIQYKDYSAWVNRQLEANRSSDEQYWLMQFEGKLPVLNLPTDYPRPKQQTYRGKKYRFTFDTTMSNAVADYAQSNNMSLFMVLLTAVDILLYYYSGQKDIVIGIPFTGRNHNSLEDQIGFYVNALSLRIQSDAEAPLFEILDEVKLRMLKAQEHSLYPSDLLLEKLGKGADLSRNGLFDVMVQIQDTDVNELSYELPDGLSMDSKNLNVESSKFDLVFNFAFLKEEKVISTWIEYNGALFNEDRLKQMQEILTDVLKELTSDTSKETTLKKLKVQLKQHHKKDKTQKDTSFADLQMSKDF